jgi:signal transduction histidine kinase
MIGGEASDRGSWAPARPLSDLAHTFVHVVESAEETRARLRYGLDLLRQIVHCDQCALLDVTPGFERRIVDVPELSAADAAALTGTLDEMLGLLSEHHDRNPSSTTHASGLALTAWRAHLAVPLISLDQVIGVLFVGRAEMPYGEDDLCLLSVVAAQIAAYLTTLRSHREKDNFIAMLSHELRTPLTAVVGWSTLLRAGSLNASDRERAVEAIARNAATLTRLTEDLLDLSRIAAGTLRVELEPISAAKVVQVCLDAAGQLAESGEIHLEYQADGASRSLLGDAERLQQVVLNLLMNAIKFTPRGGKIGVRVDHGTDQVTIEVSDTGKGISPEFLPYVFDRSRQATSSSRRGSDGLGLGLSIVRSLVELHGGRVRAASDGPGKGATFTIVLPLTAEGVEPGAPG